LTRGINVHLRLYAANADHDQADTDDETDSSNVVMEHPHDLSIGSQNLNYHLKDALDRLPEGRRNVFEPFYSIQNSTYKRSRFALSFWDTVRVTLLFLQRKDIL
jgi:hypothetical protein